MKNSHFFSSLNRSAITQVFFRVCLSLLALSSSFLRADLNNTVFIVAGGQSNDPFYNLTFESNGSIVFKPIRSAKIPTHSRVAIFPRPTI